MSAIQHAIYRLTFPCAINIIIYIIDHGVSHSLNNLILLYCKKCLISVIQNNLFSKTNVSIKLTHRAYLYLTISHEGLGDSYGAVQSDSDD